MTSLPRSLPLIVASLVASACISWRGELRELDPRASSAPDRPRELTFDAVYLVNGEEEEEGDSHLPRTVALVEETLRDTGLFSSVVPATPGAALHITFEFEEIYDKAQVSAMGSACILTLGLFPAILNGTVSLKAVLYDGGVPRDSVQYDDSMHTVMQILMLPLMPFFWTPRVYDELLRNLTLHAVHDLMSTQPSHS